MHRSHMVGAYTRLKPPAHLGFENVLQLLVCCRCGDHVWQSGADRHLSGALVVDKVGNCSRHKPKERRGSGQGHGLRQSQHHCHKARLEDDTCVMAIGNHTLASSYTSRVVYTICKGGARSQVGERRCCILVNQNERQYRHGDGDKVCKLVGF